MATVFLNSVTRLKAKSSFVYQSYSACTCMIFRNYGTYKGKESSESEATTTSKLNPDLPDYNTTIDVDSHKLSRPIAKPQRTAPSKRWTGMDDLAERTKVNICS